ncbi:MAG TPA: SDR family NAD(P)-dependent oxidoreductase [Bacteroidetes bacterium]|nr:SDR family NAD(P)-dependent oxidoreductase [Bacteroidota bacterium]
MQHLILYNTENKKAATDLATAIRHSGDEAATIEKSDADMAEQIGNLDVPAGSSIVLLVTDNFLKSGGCMNGILQAAHKWEGAGQLATVVANGVGTNEDGTKKEVSTVFDRVGDIIQYMNYWQDKYLALRKEKRNRPDDEALEEQIAITKEISADVGEFLRFLRGAGFSDLEAFKESLKKENEMEAAGEERDAAGEEKETVPEGAAILEAAISNEEKNAPAASEHSLVEMIENSSDELIAENSEIDQTYDLKKLEEELEVDEEITDEILSGIPGMDLLDENDKQDLVNSSDDSLLAQVMNDNSEEDEGIHSAPVQEDKTQQDIEFSPKEMEKIDGENEELMSILDEVLAEEGIEGYEAKEEFHFVGDDPDNPDDFDLDSLFEEDENIVPKAETEVENLDGIPVGEDEVILDLLDEEEAGLSPETGDTPEETLEHAVNLFGNKQTQAGIDYLGEAVKNKPGDTTLRYYLAYSLARYATDYGGAKTQLEALLKIDNEHPDAWFLMAELAENQQDFEGAKKCFEQVAALQPEYPEVYYRLGLLMAEHFQGEEKKTAAYFRKAIRQNSLNSDAQYMLANLLNERMGEPEKSVKHYHKTLVLLPNHPFANYDLALVYHQLGEKEKAAEHYAKAIEINPELKTEQNDLAFGYHEKTAGTEATADAPSPADDPELESLDLAQRADETEEIAEKETAINDLLNHPELESLNLAQRADETEEVAEKEAAFNDLLNDPELEKLMAADLEGDAPANAPIAAAEPTAEEAETAPVETKTVLITGATSGIGKATAEIFAKNGYRVIITGRRDERLQAISEKYASEYKADILSLSFDVREAGATQKAIENLPEEWKEIDILINNAGLSKGLSPIHEGKPDDWDTMIDTNVKGLLYMTRAIAPHMVERKRGHIINIASSAGKEVYPGGNVYCATKAAVDSLTQSMRLDLHKHNIRVSQVAPGHVEETEFARVRFDGDKEKAAQVYDNFQPLKASDVAEAIYFIATRPPHVNIQDVYMLGTQQAGNNHIDRSGRNDPEGWE